MAILRKRSIEDIHVKEKRVICRVDFNVPLDPKTGAITDDKRIVAALPTIKSLLERDAKLILMSHLGRPKNGPEARFSMAPAAKRLAELLGQEVALAKDVVGEDAKAKAQALQPGAVMMLENLRFHPEETKNDPAFARELASLAELYVNDAFGTAHRAHASTWGVANFLPSACGYLIARELEIMGGALDKPERPFTAILGGAKVSDKISVIENLLDKVDQLIIGGGMAYTFLAAQGQSIGDSLFEADKQGMAKDLLALAEEKSVRILLPVDTVVADRFAADATAEVVEGDIPEGKQGLDIGPKSIQAFTRALEASKTIVWNGPMGVFEFEAFAEGTRALARCIAGLSAVSIIGGGDSAAAIESLGFAEQVTHISTGGGASLEFLEGKRLPGIENLSDSQNRRRVAAGNWKMHAQLPAEAKGIIAKLLPQVKEAESRIILGVPMTALQTAQCASHGTQVAIAAQNCHFEDQGAYTGEISAKCLAELAVPYVILGHSERRAYFGETDATVNLKVKAARHWGLRPIVCIGESLEEREAKQTFAVLARQLEGAFAGVGVEELPFITIAYEPIWAIGTGVTASDAQAEEACHFVREQMAKAYGPKCAARLAILYGGSVNAKNCAGLFAQENIDGGLVGGASLKPDDFAVICHA